MKVLKYGVCASGAMSELIAKSGTKSIVWDYFGLERGPDGKPIDDGNVVCRTCRRRVMARHSNTSNLLSHLRTNHAKIHADVKAAMSAKGPARRTVVDVRQSTLAEAVANSQRYERKGKKWKELTDAITYFIAKDALPIYTVEKPGFK